MIEHALWDYSDEDLRRGGIYRIVHIPSGREYIGSTWCFGTRWPEHCSTLRYKRHHTQKLERSWHVHGETEFRFEILEFMDDISKQALKRREQWYFDTRKPYYNGTLSAGYKPATQMVRKHKTFRPPTLVPQHSEGLLNSPILAKRRSYHDRRVLERMTELGFGIALPDQPLTTLAHQIAEHTNISDGIAYQVLQRLILEGAITFARSLDSNENEIRRDKTNALVLSTMGSLGWGTALPGEPLVRLARVIANQAGIYITVAYRSLDRLLRSRAITCPSLDDFMVVPHRTRITELKILQSIQHYGWGTELPAISFKQCCRRISQHSGLHTEVVADGLKRLLDQQAITCVYPPGAFGNEARVVSTDERIFTAMEQLGWGRTLLSQTYNASALAIIAITGADRGVTHDALRRLVNEGVLTAPDILDGTSEGKKALVHERILAAMKELGWDMALPTQSIRASAMSIGKITHQHHNAVAKFLKRMIEDGMISYQMPPEGMTRYRASPLASPSPFVPPASLEQGILWQDDPEEAK